MAGLPANPTAILLSHFRNQEAATRRSEAMRNIECLRKELAEIVTFNNRLREDLSTNNLGPPERYYKVTL